MPKYCFPSRLIKHMALLMLAVVITLGCAVHGRAADRAFDEYQVKAVFLYRLTLFITWPENALASSDQPFVIGILGDDPFGKHIDRVIKDERFKGRPIHILRYRTIEEVKKAESHVLFINRAMKPKWYQLKQSLNDYPLLTVSDMEEFCRLGGMINIRTQVNKIKIAINPDETRMAGLKISSKLLKVSRNVVTAPEGGRR